MALLGHSLTRTHEGHTQQCPETHVVPGSHTGEAPAVGHHLSGPECFSSKRNWEGDDLEPGGLY